MVINSWKNITKKRLIQQIVKLITWINRIKVTKFIRNKKWKIEKNTSLLPQKIKYLLKWYEINVKIKWLDKIKNKKLSKINWRCKYYFWQCFTDKRNISLYY